MLIFNDEQRLRAGMKSLSKRCSSCSKALSEYPLIMNCSSLLRGLSQRSRDPPL